MSACSNFTPGAWKRDQCRECFHKESEHLLVAPIRPPSPPPPPTPIVLPQPPPIVRPQPPPIAHPQPPPIAHPQPPPIVRPQPPPTTASTSIRRVLFIGPTGVGKSTLINVLISNNVRVEDMSHPAGVGDTSSGQTRFFTTYYDLPNNAYTDTIGLGDNRHKDLDIMDSLKSVLENASIGYNKIYICLKYGRISTEIRNYIELITTMFGKSVLEWSSIIFTGCNDQTMTKEKYLEKNSQDTDFIETIKQVRTVIFGDNMTDKNAEIENIMYKRRQEFLRRIKKDLDDTVKTEYFKLKKRGLIARAAKIFTIICSSFGSKAIAVIANVKDFAAAVARSTQSSKYDYYYGECSICIQDITGHNYPVITPCCHVYHEVCLKQWVHDEGQNNCPMCRTQFDNPQNYYESLATNT
ncbi:unnamed protein product [Rotaria socialis]